MKLLLILLGSGLLNAAYAQQPGSAPPASIVLQGSTLSQDNNIPPLETVVADVKPGITLSEFRKGSDKNLTVSDLLLLPADDRHQVLADLNQYNVTPGQVSKADWSTLPMAAKLIMERNPLVFKIEQ